jgi:hypothetical protein
MEYMREKPATSGNAYDLCSGGDRIKANLNESFLSFLYPSQINVGVGHDRFLQHRSQFIIYELTPSFDVTLYEILTSP